MHISLPLKRMDKYYHLLTVCAPASEKEINRAFRRRVMELRPDLYTDTKTRETFEQLKEARAALCPSRYKEFLSYTQKSSMYHMEAKFQSMYEKLNRIDSSLERIEKALKNLSGNIAKDITDKL